MGRSYGPMSESVIMDKACREVTRDYGKIISFIQKETNSEKKEALFTLWHSIKYFCDVYDGADSIVRAKPEYAKHVVHVYEMILRQQNGRKLLIVAMAGITTPDAQYYAIWGTCRGISAAQMQVLEIYLDKMRAQASSPRPSLGDTIDNDDDDDETATGDGTDANITNDGTDPAAGGADDTIDETPAPDRPSKAIERNDGDVVANIDELRSLVTLDEFRNLTIDDLVDRVVLRTQQVLASQDESANQNPDKVVSVDTDVVMESADEAPRNVMIGKIQSDTIDREMDDSGVVSMPSQVLPQPNITIDVLDNPADAFSEDSWFDDHAQAVLQSTPTVAPDANAIDATAADAQPVKENKGKITIVLNEKDYTVICDQWSNKIHFSNFGYLQRFIYDTVKGPTATVWFSKNRRLKRLNYSEGKDNFPNFDFTNQKHNLYPRPRQVNPIDFATINQNRRLSSNSVLTAQQRRANYRRQNATVRNSPNVRNLRLHNRSGSRGSVNQSIVSVDAPDDSVAIVNEQPPVEVEQDVFEEIRELRNRLHRLERLARTKKN